MVRIVHTTGRKPLPSKVKGNRLYSGNKVKTALSWMEQRDERQRLNALNEGVRPE